MLASLNGHLEVVKLLLDHGALVEAKNDKGFTSLMIASQNERFGVMNLLSHRKRIKN